MYHERCVNRVALFANTSRAAAISLAITIFVAHFSIPAKADGINFEEAVKTSQRWGGNAVVDQFYDLKVTFRIVPDGSGKDLGVWFNWENSGWGASRPGTYTFKGNTGTFNLVTRDKREITYDLKMVSPTKITGTVRGQARRGGTFSGSLELKPQ